MADYGRPLSFGYFLIPNAVEYPRLVELAHLVDNLGLEFIGIQDHPYQRRFLDTWTLLTAIAIQTKRVRLFPDVANLPLRPPAILAKAAASLDLISGGRVELGLGAGAFWEAIAALGGPTRKPRESLTAMEEAIHVIRLMWSDQRSVRFDGQFYSLHGVHPGPAPKHPIGIWLGAYGPKMLALTGRLADGWVPSLSYAPPAQLSEQNRLIDEAAASAGRDPAAIRRVCNINGRITNGPTTSFLDGPVEHWVDELTKLSIEEGMDSYILWPTEADESQLQRFAQEVVPQVRERVEHHRRVI